MIEVLDRTPQTPEAVTPRAEQYSRLQRQFAENRLAVIGLLVMAIWIGVALAGPWLAPYGFDRQDMRARLEPPSARHWFGTDWLGRDVFSRVLWGARVTLVWGMLPIFVSVLIGVPLGLIAGYFGGRVETIIMRLADLFLSVPPLVLAIAITAALSPSLFNAVLALSLVWWPWYTRMLHAETLSLKEQVFVKAAYGMGATSARILREHILPNCLPTLLVRISMDVGFAVLAMAGLSFIGMGAREPSPEWGLAVSNGRGYMPEYWWISVFMGLAIFSVVLSLNSVGDGIRDALDPESRIR